MTFDSSFRMLVNRRSLVEGGRTRAAGFLFCSVCRCKQTRKQFSLANACPQLPCFCLLLSLDETLIILRVPNTCPTGSDAHRPHKLVANQALWCKCYIAGRLGQLHLPGRGACYFSIPSCCRTALAPYCLEGGLHVDMYICLLVAWSLDCGSC